MRREVIYCLGSSIPGTLLREFQEIPLTEGLGFPAPQKTKNLNTVQQPQPKLFNSNQVQPQEIARNSTALIACF
jgi:hypothetical protein